MDNPATSSATPSPRYGSGVGPVLEKFLGVERIAVLRGGGLGDLLYTYPALTALREGYPDAEITLLGTPIHAVLAAETAGPVTDVDILPFAQGVRDGAEDAARQDGFFATMQARKFNLALQMHGGGRFSNPFLLRLGAEHTVGTRTPDAVPLERNLDYAYYQNEPDRWLEVAGLAGVAPLIPAPMRPLPKHQGNIAPLLESQGRPLVVVHPGATDPRRRWPAAYFAEAAAKIATEGANVLVVGDASERLLAQEVAELASGAVDPAHEGAVRSVAGELGLGELAALLDAASVMLASDSGPRHLAQALGTPTVGIFWIGNVINAGPRGRKLHRIHMSWETRCPVCGIDITQVGWTAPHCGHEDTVVRGIDVAAVVQDLRDLMATSLLLRGK
ncbi:MAG TPA: glycosyltransferase family 9 protein [Arthrobacter sp.]|nr:glycosyltransferase family 9 protein [Arthrobacter sp.]